MAHGTNDADELTRRFVRTRAATEVLASRLTPDDQLVQSMPDASPTKWHLAHTSWFFERMVLAAADKGYVPVHPRYEFLFNSYYEAVGARQPRPRRALITRPTLHEVYDYRKAIDARILAAIPTLPESLHATLRLGCEHEQQHQELLLTDAAHALFESPMRPAYLAPTLEPQSETVPCEYVSHPGGIVEMGHKETGFAFDNETPRHKVWLEPFALATRCVTNGEWEAFIDDGGYHNPSHWLSDGWNTVQNEHWEAPLYWSIEDGKRTEFTLRGQRELVREEPVSHVSFYEADAYARWSARRTPGTRLPSEAEWETIAAEVAVAGNFVEQECLHPRAAGHGLAQLFGDVWEWTASPYVAYPRFTALAGALGEYNGKFMCNQMVLRGGSCLSPRAHLRASYRNFFPPGTRWQMSGVRLARWT
jgi:ergothioneine biosynthesis protein EgtB